MKQIIDWMMDSKLFEGFEKVEEIGQILIAILFIAISFFEMVDLNSFTINWPIPIRIWLAIFLILFIKLLSGVIRWLANIGQLFGEHAENRVKKGLEQR